jgi:uncharacterized protein (TIGR03067 family)
MAAADDEGGARRKDLGRVEDPNAKDLERLQGAWRVKSMSYGGVGLPSKEVERYVFAIKGNKMSTAHGRPEDRAATGTVTLDATKTPKTIDLVCDWNNQRMTGVYEVDGDVLKVCANMTSDGLTLGRPTKIASERGSVVGLAVLHRVRK